MLALLESRYRAQVDCIYIDPPYNSGASDWKYNNRYAADWLDFMRERIEAAKPLLRPDGIFVCAIDENEHIRLAALLQELFPAYGITAVAIVHNPRGIQGDNFSYTNEFALFVVPAGKKLIADRVLRPEELDTRDLRDNGGQSRRSDARNCFYPILVKDGAVIGFGEVAKDSFHPNRPAVARSDGAIEVWPVDRNGIERKWRYARQTVESIANLLSVMPARWGDTNVPQIKITKTTGKYRTVWTGSRYDANQWGTKLVRAFTGTSFPFPKSVLTVKDVLHACTANRPNALILDFFAGSGTTLHAICLLNAELGGERRGILVTNNEGGIFEEVTVPRCEAVLTGLNQDGLPLEMTIEGRPARLGFEENLALFKQADT